MANYTINFLGWCNEAGHDKVWGYVTVGDPNQRDSQLYNFWGRRGKKLAFQQAGDSTWWNNEALQKRASNKCRPRTNGQYNEVPVSQIESIVPGFFAEFENQFTLARLFDNFRHKPAEEEA